MLSAAETEYDQQAALVALSVVEVNRLATRGSVALADLIQTYQAAAFQLAQEWMPALLAEQGIASVPLADPDPVSLLSDGAALADMLDVTDSQAALDRLTETMVTDAYRTLRAVETATQEHVTSYVRSLRPPSCGRCAVLAGRVYRYSEGFQRHPNCDCLMTPTDQKIGPSLVINPGEAFDNGWISGLSQADTEAIQAGADLHKVVNVRRRAAGLRVGSSVIQRRGVLTPQGCLNLASDRADALRLLREHGYIN